ncbi:MAG TPA: ABC transporter ATP-binding protein [Patescibacteria group bacterium]|nr:ABC transporter ATP-binding protein [Patescibacteria group bacterium]
MEPVLEVREITKIFRQHGQSDFTAVDKVSFSLYSGETLGIVGESGSGKTTTVGMIIRLLEATNGQIYLNGKDITRIKGRELRDAYRDLQMVFQSPTGSFDPRRTLGDGIGESLRNRGLSRQATEARVATLLKQCGLPADYAKRYPHEVSGGQCQRAAIARALAIQPKILICDEATSSLDVTIQEQIITLLQTLQKEQGMSYLFICHNLALVQSFCDRVIVMYKGSIMESGATARVIEEPRHPYTKMLLSCILDDSLKREDNVPNLPEDLADFNDHNNGCKFYLACPVCKDICKSIQPAMIQRDGCEVACHLYA